MFEKKYYFVLKKQLSAKNVLLFYLYLLPNGKFYCSNHLMDKCMLSFWPSLYYLLKFHAPKWMYKNSKMFGYKHPTGKVELRQLMQ